MVAYLDSSVLLSYVLKGDSGILQVIDCDSIVSSELWEIECKRVIHRYRLENFLDDGKFLEALERIDASLSGLSLLRLSDEVKKKALQAFPVVIKTLDALHLSSALAFKEARPEESLLIFSYHKGFNRCARALGFTAPFHRGG